MNMPALTDVRTFDQIQLATTDRNRKTVCSDHAGVTATLRFSDIECHPPRWAHRPPQTKETKEAIKLAVTKFANKGDTTESPATQHTLLAQEIQRICKDATSAERRAKHAPLRSLNAKLKRLRANLQAGMSHRPPPHNPSADKRSILGQIRSQKGSIARIANEIARCERQIIAQVRRNALRDASLAGVHSFMREDRCNKEHFAPLHKNHDRSPITKISIPTPAASTPIIPAPADPHGGPNAPPTIAPPAPPHFLETQEEIATHLRTCFSALFSLDIQLQDADMQRITDHISNNTSCHVTSEMAEQLHPNAMFKEDNICKAIASMRPHMAAGMDGLGIDFYKTHARELAPHLRQLFLDAHSKGHMSEAMRHAVVSLLHKGKNLSRDLDKNYRPISVTATEYRILGRCIHQHLAPLIRHLIGDTQLDFVPGRRMDENILALTELVNFCDADESRGGIFVMLDNAKAYDRVQWPFLQKVLEAFQFPPFSAH